MSAEQRLNSTVVVDSFLDVGTGVSFEGKVERGRKSEGERKGEREKEREKKRKGRRRVRFRDVRDREDVRARNGWEKYVRILARSAP